MTGIDHRGFNHGRVFIDPAWGTVTPPPAGNLKALDLRLPVTPGRLGLKRQHGELLRVAGEEESAFFHMGFFSQMTVRTCFVLAAFVAGLQRAVSGCVTAHCNG